MKKLFPILLLAAVLFTSCSKNIIQPCQKPCDSTVGTIDSVERKEIKLTMTLDSLRKGASDSGLVNLRVANDGIFDYMEIADNFNQQNYWFFDSICSHQEAFMKALHPFDSLWAIGKLRFVRVYAKGNFNCKSTGGLDAALTCNWDKIKKVAYANGANPDFIHIFSYNNNYGTGNSGIGITGVGNESLLTSPWSCPYYTTIQEILAGLDPGREPKISGHEDGHGFGLDHYFPEINLMWYATSGGCALGYNFLPFQQDIVLSYIKSKIQ